MERKIKVVPHFKKWVLPLGIVFLFLAFILFAGLGGYLTYDYSKDEKYYIETQATIVEIKEDITSKYDEDEGWTTTIDYTVYVDYEVDGIKYGHVKLNFYNAGMEEGEEITVMYDLRDPSVLVSKNAMILFILVLGMSLIPLFFGIYETIVLKGRNKYEKYLRENGVKVRAVITEITKKYSRYGDIEYERHYGRRRKVKKIIYMVCKYDDETFYVAIKENDELYPGCTVDIYVDPTGRKRGKFGMDCYYVDFESVRTGEPISNDFNHKDDFGNTIENPFQTVKTATFDNGSFDDDKTGFDGNAVLKNDNDDDNNFNGGGFGQ